MVKRSLFEDKKRCIALAKAPRMNPITTYIFLKYHHLRSFVSGKAKRVDIAYVESKENIADILKKPLPDIKFIHLKKKLCGW